MIPGHGCRDVDMIGRCLHGVLCMHVSVSCLHIISLCLSSGKLPHLNIPSKGVNRNFVVIFVKSPISTFSFHTLTMVSPPGFVDKGPNFGGETVYKFSK